MDKIAFKDLLKRYLGNDCSDDERLLVEKLYELLGEEKKLVLENLDDLEDEIWDRIKLKTDLKGEIFEEGQAKLMPLPWYKRANWIAAAGIFLLGSLGIGLLLQQPFNAELTNQTSIHLSTILNDGPNQKICWLEDSTKVILSPNSKINLPGTFKGLEKREVYLTGEAVFDVTKNPDKPFLVYTGDIVTRVIGTSFKITDKDNSGKDNIEVVVLSGKVSVYNNEKSQPKQKEINNGVVLVPNQKVIYHSDNKQFVTAVVDDPILLPVAKNKHKVVPSFIYKDTPVELVLSELEMNYGIQIEVVENELFMNCPLTANLSKQSLFNKLEMICTSLNATYERKGTIILINGKGCNN